MWRALAVAALGYVLAAAPPALAAPTAAVRLHSLAEEVVDFDLDANPLLETFAFGRGPRAGRFRLSVDRDSIARQRRFYRSALRRLEAIPADRLAEPDRHTHAILRFRLERSLAEPDRLRPPMLLTTERSVHGALIYLAHGAQPFGDEEDFEKWLARVEAASDFAPLVRALESARRHGWTTPRPLVEKWLAQAEGLVTKPAHEGPLWAPIARYPTGGERRADFEARYRRVLEDRFVPGLKRLVSYVRESYLPRARTTAGIGAMPGGRAAYAELVRRFTTLDLSADEVHAVGLEEMARIRPRLLEVARGLGFRGEMKDLQPWLEQHPDNHPFRTPEGVLEHLRAVHERVVPHLPKLFRRLPEARFEIQLTPKELAATASASYLRPSADGSRPGVFSMPVRDPRTVGRAELATILLHEGMPGHHLDGGLQGELALPRLRRTTGIIAYSEGWGLYAEGLGHELGIYDDPWSLLGRYLLDLHRAARLVVDTGLHAKGWTRERAIRFQVEERGESEANAVIAVERYMANPGQALAYKIGEREILALRERARSALGERFDLRDFHEAVLGAGPLTLPMLRRRVEAWIASNARAGGAVPR
jgi:uncharacterized protein (DUF885 family)